MGIQENINLIGQVNERENPGTTTIATPLPSFGGRRIRSAGGRSHVGGQTAFLSDKAALPEIGGNVAFYFRDFSGSLMQETFAAGMHGVTSNLICGTRSSKKERNTAGNRPPKNTGTYTDHFTDLRT